MTTYECAECGKPVTPVNEDGKEFRFERTCEHTEAAIIANLQAQVTGASSVE